MRSWLLGLFVVGGLACGPRVDAPRLDQVRPATIPFGSPERLLLTGSFAPDLAVDLGAGTAPTLENRFEVRIGPERAYAVRFLSRDSLEATAPATLPPGPHDVTVTDAQGHTTTLSGVFEVVDPGVQRLVFVTSMRAALPGAWSEPIRLELRDSTGRPTPTALPRTLRLTSDSGTGRFARTARDEGQPSLEVALAPGETGAELVYQDATPGYHTLESSSRELSPITQTIAVGRLGPPTAVRFTRLPTAPLVAGLPVALALEVLDASGGPASLPATGIQLELSTDSPAGGLALTDGEPSHAGLSLVLHDGQGLLPLLYRDTRAAGQVRLSARAFNRDTLGALASDERVLEVGPGATDHLEVLREGHGPPRVGVPEPFTLQALDAFGNLTPYTGPVLLGTLPADADFSPVRVTLEAGQAPLFAEFTRVQAVSVVATIPNRADVRGVSAELSLRPGPPALLRVLPIEGPQVAGRPFLLTIAALDRFGNTTQTPLSVTLSAAGVAEGALSPTTSGTFSGMLSLPVTITSAVASTRLRLLTEDSADTEGLGTTTGGFAVLPGSTQRFVVEDTAGTQRAGVPWRVHLRAVDTWGNTTQEVRDLDLGAEGLPATSLTPARILGFQGQADVELTLTRAAAHTRVTVVSGGASGQQSSTFPVEPGGLAGFTLETPACLTERDRWRLTLRAVDAWGNLVTGYTGTASLALAPFGTVSPSTTRPFSEGLLIEPNAVLGEVAGRAPAQLQLTVTDSTDGGRTGSAPLSLRPACPAPPP